MAKRTCIAAVVPVLATWVAIGCIHEAAGAGTARTTEGGRPAGGEADSPPPSYVPPLYPPTPVPPSGERDYAPVLLGSGGTIAWIHQRNAEVYLCVGDPPYRSVRSMHRLSGELSEVNVFARVAASGDGRHVFVALPGGVVRITPATGAAPVEERIEGSGFPLGLAPDADGDRLFVEVDGPPSATRSPGWRAIGLHERTGAGWEAREVSRREDERIARLVGVRADGRAVLYTENMVDRWGTPERIVMAEESGAVWEERELALGGLAVGPEAMTPDGATILLRGFDPGEGAEQPQFHLYVARREGDGWGGPQRIVLDTPATDIFVPCLAPDGTRICWAGADWDESGDVRLRTEIRTVRARAGSWTPAQAVFGRAGFLQVENLACDGSGHFVFSSPLNDPADANMTTRVYAIGGAGGATDTVVLSDLEFPCETAIGIAESPTP